MSYNKKDKMIKIEQYEQDPKREGHEIKVSVLAKKSPKSPIPPKPKPPKSKTTKELLLEFMSKQDGFNSNVNTRFDRIETDIKSIKTIVEYNVQLNILKTPK
ncbi:MAG: hypothetical protein LBS76_04110 [Mycoplasmataceae bacterium]|jgi:hypothetical protein|nr:hypothetical protein [Mycoplasmataceae bacterium]